MKSIICILITCFTSVVSFGQSESVWIHPNRGQWDNQIQYQVDLQGGKMYIEKDGFTYHFYDSPQLKHDHKKHDILEDEIERHHVVKSKFIGSNWSNQAQESNPSFFYRNYFLGSDDSKWKSEVYSYENLILNDFYPSIDLQVNGENGKLKYSFIVAPGANFQEIKWKIDGADKIKIDNIGNLVIETSLGTITETKPIAWTISNGVKKTVPIEFKLSNNLVTYKLPSNFSTTDTLVIDPNLVFSTYTGATTDNWGMTATPGPNGETYAGGIIFGAGYPTTTGAYDVSFNGGTPNNNLLGFDVAISKFSVNGTQLLYSTYLGGIANELPQSMIATETGDLCILGITASDNFPLGTTPYQSEFKGGPTVTHNSLKFVGTDLFVVRLNEAGTALLASTYVGGTSLDGLNPSTLNYNYGDQFRGEINLHGNEVIIVSHSRSNDFPVTNGSSLAGNQDIVAFRLSTDLSTMVWSSYFGGTGDETGNSSAITNAGALYIAGGTTSNNFQLNGHTPTYAADRDGYILKLNALTGEVVAGTYVGSGEYDQVYFVRTDIDNEVYVFGQTSANWTITPGKYGNPNSGQFIRKYSNNLQNIIWTTMIGAGRGAPEISPTAFLISDCYEIFITGWGGTVNVNGSQASSSSTEGFPVTSDAYQSITHGSNFYLAILSQDANNLVYGTFMGGLSGSHNHVDGGTSRFDKSGAVYHAVCAACGGNPNGFVSTPGVWSTTNNSTNCNLAAFKFQLGLPYSLGPNRTICKGDSTQLNVSGGVTYTWSPANSLNNPNIANPIATPTETTVYYVSMDFNEGCAITDSIIVEVIDEPIIELDNSVTICQYDTITISASGGTTYTWSPLYNINPINSNTVQVWPEQSMYYYVNVGNECFTRNDSIYVVVNPAPEIIVPEDTTICIGQSATLSVLGDLQIQWVSDPTLTVGANNTAIVTPTTSQYYYVHGTDVNGCSNRDSILVKFFETPTITITPDTTICEGTSITLSASGGNSYSWSPIATLSNTTGSSTVASPLTETTYVVQTTYGNNCPLTKEVTIGIMYLPSPIVPDTTFACAGVPKEITVGGADSYLWTPATYLNTTTGATVIATVYENMDYIVHFTNICGTVTDTVSVVSISPVVEAFKDTIICPGETVQLFATGSFQYQWYPPTGLNNTISSSVFATPAQSTTYYVRGTDSFGCNVTDSVRVELFPQPYIIASHDQYLFEGESAVISGTTSSAGTIFWTPGEYLSCVMCSETVASPPDNMRYIVTIVDENGCRDSDDVWILFEPLVYVPNTFTPNGDEYNSFFKAYGGNIRDFELMIFDRWGELVTTLHNINDFWDGTYKGNDCQDGTYTWKMKYKNLAGTEFKKVGHVNLLR